MMHTNYQFEFCPMCGGKCKSLNLKEHEPTRLVCSECDFIFYLDPKLVACAIVESEGKIVLLAAALRETEEECGLKIRLKNLLGVYSYPGQLEVVIVYVAEVTSGSLMVGDETQAARLFEIEDIPWEELAFESTQDALRDYSKRGENI